MDVASTQTRLNAPIVTRRLILRAAAADDIPALCRLINDKTIAMNTGSIRYPHPAISAWRWLARVGEGKGGRFHVPYVLARRSNPRLIVGGAGIDFYDAKPPQIGYWIARAHRRKGFAGEAARALVRQIFSLSDTESVAAYCWASNIASQRVLKSAGMRLVGRGHLKSTQRGRHVPTLFMRVERKSWEKAQTWPSH